jgi:multiple sugar transport system substrate-binding protein
MANSTLTRRGLVTGAAAATAIAAVRPAAASARQPAAPTTLEYWHVNTETFGGPTNKALFARFEELNPGLTVRDRYHANSYGGLMENLQTALAAGNPPDVAQIGYLYLDYAADTFPIAPIDDLVAEYGPADFLAGFPEHVLDLGRIDGTLVGMPFSVSNPVTYFNGDLFREAGLDPDDPPTDWAGWRDAARAITDATGKPGITLEFYAGGNWLTQALIGSNGGRLLHCVDGARRAAFATPEAVAAIQVWADLVADGTSLWAPGDLSEPAFLAGETAAFIGSIASRDSFQTQATFDLRATGFPRFGDRDPQLPVGGNALFVFAQDPARRRAAWEFITFMESPASLTLWTEGTGYIPPRDGLADNPEFLGDFLRANPIQAVGVAQTPYVVPWTAFPGANGLQAANTLSDAVEEAVIGERAVADALDAAAPEVDALIAGESCS